MRKQSLWMNDKNRNVIRYGLLTTSHGTCFHFTRTDRNVQYWPAKVSYLIIYNTQTICPQCNATVTMVLSELTSNVVFVALHCLSEAAIYQGRRHCWCPGMSGTFVHPVCHAHFENGVAIPVHYLLAFICEVCCFKGNTWVYFSPLYPTPFKTYARYIVLC